MMKHLKLFFALFAMLALGVGNAWAEEYALYSGTITEGDYVIVYDGNAMNNTVSSSRLGYTAVTITGDKISNPDATIVWHIAPSGDYWTIFSANVNKYAASTGAKNKAQLLDSGTDDKSLWTVSGSSTYEFVNKANAAANVNKNLRQNGTYGFACYATSTGGALSLYKKVEQSGGGETPEPDPDPTPDPEDPTPGTGGEALSYTWDLSTNSYSAASNTQVTWSATDVNMVADKGTAGTAPNNYLGGDANNRTSSRFYGNSILTITPEANVTITSVVFTATSTSYASALQGSTWTNASASVSGTTVTVTPTNGASAISATIGGTCGFTGVTVNYTKTGTGSGEPVASLTTDQFSWSVTTATATLPNTFDNPPTLTNTESLAVSYSSSKGEVATIDESGNVTLVGKGETIISATAGDDETYKKTTVSYTLTVKPAPLAPIAGGVIDTLNQGWTGVTGTNYTDVAAKTAENEGHSNAQYVAQCAGDKSSIQLRSNNNNSGVVSTISGGIVKRVEVEWQNETTAGRILQVYGSNTAYEAATDLYSDDKKGELLGEITMGGDETVVDYSQWTGDYKYIGLRSKSGAMYLTTITITWLPINSKVTIDDAIQNGSISVSGAADLNAVAAGTILTLTNTPEAGYKHVAYNVYKTGDASTTVIVTDNKFIMPEFDVTISATFEQVKTLTGIEITTPATQTTFWQGETFNSTDLKVTAHFDGAADEDVTDKVTVTGSTATAGTQTVSVSYKEGATTETATYNITVKAIPNTKETAYTVADAFDIIDKLTTANGVFISGIISQVDSYNSTYQSITYWISADGTTTNQLQVYGGKGLNNADFASKLDLTVGDQVIVVGNLKKYNSTYEFDANNYLASHTPTTKDPAGLAYATTSYTANVGETFTTPELTNPHNLVVTYSTSDASKATVDANNGAVTIVAAGVVTITAATTGDATHDAGSASYTITISNPAMAVATLPFTFNSGKADIENTAGMTQEGLGNDYSGTTNLRFDNTGDCVIIHFNGQAEKLAYDIKGNSFSNGTFTVQQSADGSAYTDVVTYTELGNAATKEHELAAESRYVKFIYTEKSSGNVGLGNIKITEPDNRAEAGLAWNPASVTLTQGKIFTAPTLNNPYSVSGITYESSNEEVATVTAGGEIALASATGTATITATFAGDLTYKPATATCTITVNEHIETIDGEWQLVTDASKLQAGMEIIIASVEVDGKYYTMSKASDNGNNRTAVESTISGDKLNPAVGTSVLTLVDAGNGTFALQAGNNYLYAASSGSNHLKEKDEIVVDGQWTITIADNVATIKAEGSSNRNWMQFNPNNGSPLFSCYAYDKPQKDIALYARVPDHSRTTSAGRYGTICLPGNIVKCLGATLYEVAGKDGLRVVFDEVLTPEAGMPYIFLAHNAEVLFYCGDQTAAAGNHKSLHGTFEVLQDAQLKGMYIVQNNKIVKCADTGCGVAENRAYFDGDELDALGKPGAQMPGRKRITMGTESENTATGTEDVVAPAGQTLKIIENGQLIIIRGDEKFNAQGQKL